MKWDKHASPPFSYGIYRYRGSAKVIPIHLKEKPIHFFLTSFLAELIAS
jgi:hypothetical protein